MTQTQVAEVFGGGQTAVSRLESGAHDPRLSSLRRYARALGADCEIVFHMRSGTRVKVAI